MDCPSVRQHLGVIRRLRRRLDRNRFDCPSVRFAAAMRRALWNHDEVARLHRRAGKSDDHLRRIGQSGIRNHAICRERHRVIGLGGVLQLTDHACLHPERQHGHPGRGRHLHGPCGAGGKCQFQRGGECRSKLHGDPGHSNYQLRRTCHQGRERCALHRQRQRVVRPGGVLRFVDRGCL